MDIEFVIGVVSGYAVLAFAFIFIAPRWWDRIFDGMECVCEGIDFAIAYLGCLFKKTRKIFN